MASKTSSSIKKEDTYDALRDKGYSKEKSARIANAQANDHQAPSRKAARPHLMKPGPGMRFMNGHRSSTSAAGPQ